MANSGTKFNATQTLEGLHTTTLTTVPVADTYQVAGSLTLPANSQVVVVVKKNASTSYTGIAGATGFQCQILCAAGDVLSTVLSSSAAQDQGTNIIKGNVQVWSVY